MLPEIRDEASAFDLAQIKSKNFINFGDFFKPIKNVCWFLWNENIEHFRFISYLSL